MAINTLLESEMESKEFDYDQETLTLLEKISEDAFSGKSNPYTVEESLGNIGTLRAEKRSIH